MLFFLGVFAFAEDLSLTSLDDFLALVFGFITFFSIISELLSNHSINLSLMRSFLIASLSFTISILFGDFLISCSNSFNFWSISLSSTSIFSFSARALKALAEKEKIDVKEIEIDQKLKEFEQEIEKSPNKIDIGKLRAAIRNDLVKDKLIEWLDNNSEIIEKKVTKTKPNSKKATKGTKAKSSINTKTAKKETTKDKEEKK